MEIDVRWWKPRERESLLSVLERGGARAKYDAWIGHIHFKIGTYVPEKRE